MAEIRKERLVIVASNDQMTLRWQVLVFCSVVCRVVSARDSECRVVTSENDNVIPNWDLVATLNMWLMIMCKPFPGGGSG